VWTLDVMAADGRRAGWRLGHDEYVANRATWEAGVKA
jgi:hypothetical protein